MKSVILTIIAAIAIILIGRLAVTNVMNSSETGNSSVIQLSDASYGVTVSVEEHPEEPMIPMLKLREMTERELVDSCDLIVRGTVKSIRNIRLTADGVDVTRAPFKKANIVTMLPTTL